MERNDRMQITKDWLSAFPSFAKYQTMHLVRRNGPFLCGIYLDVHSGRRDYQPCFHIHNLMVSFPAITLSGQSSLLNRKGAAEAITLPNHDENFPAIAERLKNQESLLQNDSFGADEFVGFLKNAVDGFNGYPYCELRDIVLALFWCNRIKDAEDEFSAGKRIISRWPKEGLVWNEVTFENEVRASMDRDMINRTVEEQLIQFKLTSLTDHGLR
jgi:hypothetical protein